MPKVKVNGREVEVPAGTPAIKACLDNGAFVPHYCWHPGLSAAGNCRMCLVKVSNSRKLEVSCMYPCTDGLEITTEGPEVAKARQDVLEFLLINHPLDCPICDKAGECDLQDFAYQYRNGLSRFTEPKNIRPTKDLGPDIRIWGNRCIACTRCIRFCDEISGTGELCMVERGDHSVVDVFPGTPIDNPMSLNVVDVCPVGALIDKNFLYAARVWFAGETETVCASCSRGCNVKVTALDGNVKRIVARPNPDVNKYWMCDEGRSGHVRIPPERRLVTARGSAREIGAGAAALVKKHGAGSVAGIVSTAQTIEELYLFMKLMTALQAEAVAVVTHTRGPRQEFKGGFVIEEDKTPNRAFAEMAFDPVGAGLEAIVAGIGSGKIKGLVVVNGIPEYRFPVELALAADRLEFLAVVDLQTGPLAEKAHVCLPAASWLEKEGTFVNADRRIQRIRRAIAPPVAARPESEILQDALIGAGARERVVSVEGVFREVASQVVEFAGLDYGKLGTHGALLPKAEAVTR